MKATGIVRRVDDLGRIVIPKEIRRRRGAQKGVLHHFATRPFVIVTVPSGG